MPQAELAQPSRPRLTSRTSCSSCSKNVSRGAAVRRLRRRRRRLVVDDQVAAQPLPFAAAERVHLLARVEPVLLAADVRRGRSAGRARRPARRNVGRSRRAAPA